MSKSSTVSTVCHGRKPLFDSFNERASEQFIMSLNPDCPVSDCTKGLIAVSERLCLDHIFQARIVLSLREASGVSSSVRHFLSLLPAAKPKERVGSPSCHRFFATYNTGTALGSEVIGPSCRLRQKDAPKHPLSGSREAASSKPFLAASTQTGRHSTRHRHGPGWTFGFVLNL